MNLRLELFVNDMDRSINFYRDILGFALLRRDSGYASIRRGNVTFGLGPIAKLSEEEGYFTRSRVSGERGLGVEIVLEVDDLAAALAQVERAHYPVHEPVQRRPWGLSDFRLIDPDGYYLRITTRG
jgi:lactoylglutathione lyase